MKHNAKPWTQDDLNIIKEFYPTEGASYCAKLLRRTDEAVMAKAVRIGIKKDKTPKIYLEQNLREVIDGSKTISDVFTTKI